MSWAGNPTPVQPPLAGWWYRVGATVIDNILLFIVARIFGAIGGTGLQNGVLLAISIAYAGVLISQRGQTVGMSALKVRCVDAQTGGPISSGRAFGRSAVAVLLSITVIGGILDALWPLWDARNQTLHDKVVSTIVVMTTAPATAPPYPSSGAYGGGYQQPSGGWQQPSGGYQEPSGGTPGGGWGEGGGWPPSTPPTGTPPPATPPTATPPTGGWSPGAGAGAGWQPAPPALQPSAPSAQPAPSAPSAQPQDASIPAAWYPDPAGSGQERWWDGRSWTDHLRTPS